MNFGNVVKQCRESAGMNQKELAVKLKKSTTWICQIEKGRKTPSLDLLEEICKVCGVSLPVMMWFSVNEEDVPKEKRQHFWFIKPIIDAMIQSLNMDIK